ncbi:hypothetical protein BDR04DRAFT_1145001 [Suillus decipiens]|nr:hypothetical protein BDR04DRAFT_1145001 [Suillus decipiens]
MIQCHLLWLPMLDIKFNSCTLDVTNGTCKNISVVAGVAWQTLRDWSRSLHVSCSDHANSRQLLQPFEEDAVKDWLVHESGAACPVHPHELCVQVKDISGKLPGKHWYHHHLACHKKSIHTHKPWNLDPKLAQNFNKTTVKGYFDLWEGLDKKYNGIPAAHNWNMDEKGAQMAGGLSLDHITS